MINYERRNRIMELKHIVAAHSMTDKGPVYDQWHYFDLVKKLLEVKFARLINALNVKSDSKFIFGQPKIYFNNMKITEGVDDDIINGVLTVYLGGHAFPGIDMDIDINNKKFKLPEFFVHGSDKYDLNSEGIIKFFTKVNPKYDTDFGKQQQPNQVASSFFGDPSKDRQDLLMGRRDMRRRKKDTNDMQPIETGDESMLGKSTQQTVGLYVNI